MGADPAGRDERRQAAVDELLGLLRPERRDDVWVAQAPDWFGPVVFGGISLALTLGAASRDAPEPHRLHSLHAHFLRPVLGGQEVLIRSLPVKQGRTLTIHDVTASQDGRTAIAATCSFTTDTFNSPGVCRSAGCS